MDEEKIDFVVLWVDDTDQTWLEKKTEYQKKENNFSQLVTGKSRFRDWDVFQYWFRGVEKFAPWVNKIHLVTDSQIPKWLKTDHPKLNIVSHIDFLNNDYLPVYNSRAIEVNLHRIPDLSENFVYFNDDTFIIKPVSTTLFFKNSLPMDQAILAPIISMANSTGATISNDMEIINKYFHKKDCIKKDKWKWFNLKYGLDIVRTISLIYYKNFPGFFEPHLPTSFTKKTFNEIWSKEESILDKTSSHRFKSKEDVNQWVFRYWQLASGQFSPRSHNWGKFYELSNDNKHIYRVIRQGKYPIICINDRDEATDFKRIKHELKETFDLILNEKSSFEK